MIPYPNINPDLFSIGPIHVRWYGVMYVLGFLAAYFLIQKQERAKQMGLVGTAAQDLIFYLAIGLIAGGRLGYILFYEYNDFMPYIKNPLEIIATWHGGMSFHGGLIGCVIAGWIFARRRKIPFAALADCAIVTCPIGLGLGRSGQFHKRRIAWPSHGCPRGRMVFPAGGPVPRHPTQLYESTCGRSDSFHHNVDLAQEAFQRRHDGAFFSPFLRFFPVYN